VHTKSSQQAAAAGVEVTRSREDFIFQPSAYKSVQAKESLQQQHHSGIKDSQGDHRTHFAKTMPFSRLPVAIFTASSDMPILCTHCVI
jgi:hypothetical protein